MVVVLRSVRLPVLQQLDWSRSGYRGGRFSEAKGNPLACEDRVKVVMIA